MLATLITLSYIVTSFIAARVCYRLADSGTSYRSSDYKSICIIAGLAWPFTLVAVVVWWIFKATVFAPTPKEKVKRLELKANLERLWALQPIFNDPELRALLPKNELDWYYSNKDAAYYWERDLKNIPWKRR